MPHPYRTDQGTVIPSLFVGLGGVGSQIVDRIAARAAGLPNWETQLKPLTTFVCIDTNEHDQHSLKLIPQANRLNIAAFDKAKVVENLRRSRDAQTEVWLDRGYQPRAGFNPGAGQIRLESRLGFFYHSPTIKQRFVDLVTDLLRPGVTWRQKEPPKLNVYLYCTLAGGTGSGSFLSAAYLIDEVIRAQQWQPRLIANLLLSTLLTDDVGPELHPDIHANTYAALKELEHLTKLDYDQVKQAGRTSEPFVYLRNETGREPTRVDHRPFFLTFILDRAPHLGLRHPWEAIADAAFLQVFTPIIDKLAGELDNYEKNLEGLTRFPGALRDLGEGYTKNFGAYGAAALVLPGEDLTDYCALRFAAQAVRSQITFGLDQSGATDDRARALAKLAVDYTDAKFQRMSDAGREQVINAAFVASVQELARQDANEELRDGYWYQLVESVDRGPAVAGPAAGGEETRGETLMARVERRLAEARRGLINQIAIKDRSMFFPRESVNAYIDYIAKLEEEVRGGNRLVDLGLPALVRAAEEGEAIAALALDPIAERYLVVRLLEVCGGAWIPEAESQVEATGRGDLLTNPAVRKRLREDIYGSLQRAAGAPNLFGRGEREFEQVKQEAQAEYTKTRGAAVNLLDAKVRLAQFRALLDYLARRSRQYVRLATRMDGLVRELEAQAEQLRRGDASRVPPFALRVEVFETLEEPRTRLWREVYDTLFIAAGRYLGTFDRQLLARTVAQQLKPVVQGDGRVVEKGVDQTVTDLREALVRLGRERLGLRILGGTEEAGLDIAAGLALESALVLGAGADAAAGAAYRTRKLRALDQIAGLLGRVDSAESRALDDGVIVNRTRLAVLGGSAADGRGTQGLRAALEDVLSSGGRQVKVIPGHDPRLVIVHDVELPIPLYYFSPVTHEIEDAYLKVAANERRGYKLHTDFHWEESLPNLNPRRAELAVGWALTTFARGLTAGVFSFETGGWTWHRDGTTRAVPLHPSLAGALYRLGEIHAGDELRKDLDDQLEAALDDLGPAGVAQEAAAAARSLRGVLGELNLKRLDGAFTREDALDQPILRALLPVLEALTGDRGPAAASADSPYRGFGRRGT